MPDISPAVVQRFMWIYLHTGVGLYPHKPPPQQVAYIPPNHCLYINIHVA